MIILGIDPGTRTTGYGLIEKNNNKVSHIENGLIIPKAKDPLPQRLEEIFRKVSSLLQEYKPAEIALEDVFVAKNVRSTMKLGYARGVILLAASLTKIPIFEYTPAQVKQTIANFGQATKEQIQKMVAIHLRLKEAAAEDASDALAVALCHGQTKRFGT